MMPVAEQQHRRSTHSSSTISLSSSSSSSSSSSNDSNNSNNPLRNNHHKKFAPYPPFPRRRRNVNNNNNNNTYSRPCLLVLLLAFLSLGYHQRTTHRFLGNGSRSLRNQDTAAAVEQQQQQQLVLDDARLSSSAASSFQSSINLFASNGDDEHHHDHDHHHPEGGFLRAVSDRNDPNTTTTMNGSILLDAGCPPSLLSEHLLVDMVVTDPHQSGGHPKTCHGVLVRDDIILSTGANSCAPLLNGGDSEAAMQAATIPKLPECRGQACKISVLSRIRDSGSGGDAITLYQVHPQQQPSLPNQPHSGWPRLRVQLLLLTNTTTTTTTAGESENSKLSCHGSSRPPVLSLPWNTSEATTTRLKNLLPSRDILASDANDDDDDEDDDDENNKNGANILFAPLTDDTNGDTWWIRKRSRQELVDTTKAALWKKYSAEHIPGALGLSEGSGAGGYLQMEDPRGRRDMSCLHRYYRVWKSERPFSGVPFYDWLDLGAGREAEHPRCPHRDEFNRQTYKCFTPAELDRARVHLTHRELTDDTTMIFHNGTDIREGKYVYVWTLERNVYIARIRNMKKNNNYELVGHGSFTCGMPVYMAGEIVVGEGGVVTEINCESGHYKPRAEHLVRFMEYLQWQWSVDLRSIEWTKQPMFSDDEWSMVKERIATA